MRVWGAECDKCGKLEIFYGAANKGMGTEILRSRGWSIGKYTLCPKCRNEKKKASGA